MNKYWGQPIYYCYIEEFGRYKMLGSITSEGFLEVLRGHQNLTVIQVKEFFIQCKTCGFKKYYNLESEMINQSQHVQS